MTVVVPAKSLTGVVPVENSFVRIVRGAATWLPIALTPSTFSDVTELTSSSPCIPTRPSFISQTVYAYILP